jgi:hypothetical protein
VIIISIINVLVQEKLHIYPGIIPWEDSIKMNLKEIGSGACFGVIWPRTGTNGGIL